MSTFIKNSSPSLAKRIEKEITNEAVKEDKTVQHALKELHNLEKADKKGTKRTDKAEKALDKAEHKEDTTQRALNKAAKKHQDAVAMISRREKELEALRVKEEKTHAALNNVKVQVEESIREKDAHEKERMRRLEAASVTSSYVERGAKAANHSPENTHSEGLSATAKPTNGPEGIPEALTAQPRQLA